MEKTDQKKLEAYSLSLSEKLINEFFSLNKNISGGQILKFTPIEQVNLFIIKNLFDKWKEENLKLRSPYFDYEHAEVKEAMSVLLVKLSQHISVKKEDFIQLLNKAIYDTFLILLEPVCFLKNEYLNREIIIVSELKEREKYIRINKAYLKSFIEESERQNKLTVSRIEADTFLHSISSPDLVAEDSYKYFNSFSSLLKIEPTDILLNMPFNIPSVKVEETIKEKEKEEVIAPKPEPVIVKKDEPVINNVLKNEHSEVKAPVSDGMINEKFSKEFITLNDKLKHDEGETLIQKHSKKKIAEIKEAITLNQKFIFIKELLNGDASEYNNLLSAIDQCENYQAALHLLNNNYSAKLKWLQDKAEVKEFYAIVERKFN